MAKPSTTAVTEESKAELVKTPTTAELAVKAGIDLAADSETLTQEFERSDFQMPFLVVLQSNSPQIKEDDPKFVEGAQQAWMLATATKELFNARKSSVIVVPVSYRKTFIEWRIREAGSGFIKDHGAAAGTALLAKCTKDEKGRMIVPGSEGKHQLVETMQYAILYVSQSESSKDEAFQAIFSLTSTQLKKGRAWNTAIDSLRIDHPSGDPKAGKIKPPMFYQAYSIVTVPEKNDKGSWYGVKIEPHAPTLELPNGSDIYLLAREFKKAISEGAFNMEDAAKADPNASEPEASAGSSDASVPEQVNGAF
jgi:hypothetical protein